MKVLLSTIALFLLFCGHAPKRKIKSVYLQEMTVTDCVACERINLFITSKELVSSNIWKGLNTKAHIRPLLYFTDSNTYVAFGSDKFFGKYDYDVLKCRKGLSLLKLPRIDKRPFHMENSMNFKDTASLYYNQPMMLCSDVETLLEMVPDFNKTEDWLQLVMHEYFHSFQFSHQATMNYFASTIQISADTLDKIYLQNPWFRESLEKENSALLNAIRTTTKDSINLYINEFFQARQQRRLKFESSSRLDLSVKENFWETVEGTARYVEYYMAGNFNHIASKTSNKCDSLFKNFRDYSDRTDFEHKQEFRKRTEIMAAYYYVTGFNLCRLMDKMGMDYKQDIFNNPTVSLYEIFTRNVKH